MDEPGSGGAAFIERSSVRSRASPATDDSPPIDLAGLDQIVGYVVRRAQVWIYQDARRSLKEHDITPAQFTVMKIIAANPGLAQVRVAEALLIERARLVAMLDRLEERGLITRARSAADRRSHELNLTAEGAGLLERLARVIDEHERRVLAKIGPEGRTQLLQVLAAFIR